MPTISNTTTPQQIISIGNSFYAGEAKNLGHFVIIHPARDCNLGVKQTNLPSSVLGVAVLVLRGSRGALLPASPTAPGKHDHLSSTKTQLFQLRIHFTLQNKMFPPPAQPLGLCSARLPLTAVRVSLHREWVIEPPTCKALRGSVPASFINHGSPPPHPWKSSLPFRPPERCWGMSLP